MEFDKNGKVYWESLTPRQKFEWDYLDIDPTVKRRPNNEKVCSKHLEPYVHKCPRCQEYFDLSVYEHMSSNHMLTKIN
jgi:hypothetical protein